MDEYIEHKLKHGESVEKIADGLIFNYHGKFSTREHARDYINDLIKRRTPAPATTKAKR